MRLEPRPSGLTGTILATWLLANRTELTEAGCLKWTGGKNKDGYGRLGYDGGMRLAHRLLKTILHGSPASNDLVCDHICRNRSCVNPDHVRWVTQSVNALENSECPQAKNAAKTACPKCGGEYENTRGIRRCRKCQKANMSAWYLKNKEHRRAYHARRKAARDAGS